MKKKIVYSLCDLTGNIVIPWAEAGYRCIVIDIQHRIRNPKIYDYEGGGSLEYRWGDVRHLGPLRRARFISASPPCTHLATSGARDWKQKGLRLYIDALEIVESCRLLCEFSKAPYMIENPVSRLSTSWRKPDYTFSPYEYGDPYTKTTHLWVGNGFVMPKKKPVEITKPDYIHKLSDHDKVGTRSITPMGFARAIFKANQ